MTGLDPAISCQRQMRGSITSLHRHSSESWKSSFTAQSWTLDFRQGDELKVLDNIPRYVYIVSICSVKEAVIR
jgi:hypothetical protein